MATTASATHHWSNAEFWTCSVFTLFICTVPMMHDGCVEGSPLCKAEHEAAKKAKEDKK